uniref:Uncharacterized protein n=1 Tax=Leersia perrieri TaxID=77586 RepID=A0A0D9V0G2_9ORYZ
MTAAGGCRRPDLVPAGPDPAPKAHVGGYAWMTDAVAACAGGGGYVWTAMSMSVCGRRRRWLRAGSGDVGGCVLV